MSQELIDLRASILAGRYKEALAIVDELEGMSKQAILRNISAFLIRIMIHLIKNQIEQRLTNSWVASISDSVLEIKGLNLKDNKASHYIKADEWVPFLEDAIERAIRPASVEVLGGRLKPFQLEARVDRPQLIATAQTMLALTYGHSLSEVSTRLDRYLSELPGGAEWYGNQN